MIIEDNLTIKAPVDKVWGTMLDVSFLASCIPGVEDLKTIDDNHYKATLVAKVSVMTAIFDTDISIIERQEPSYIKIAGEGKGRMGVGRVAFSQAVKLKSVSTDETEVAYKLELNVIGRLASLGGKAISKKVTEVSEIFRKEFAAKCESGF